MLMLNMHLLTIPAYLSEEMSYAIPKNILLSASIELCFKIIILPLKVSNILVEMVDL